MMTEFENQLTEEEFQAAMQRLDGLVQEFETLPYPQIREKVFELLQTVDAVHREGLRRLIGLVEQDQPRLLERAGQDPIIRALLGLYDLVPGDELNEAEKALQVIRPYIHSHGGEVEILDVVDGIVHLRLSGSCHGCPGSTTTLKRGIAHALREGLPGFKGLQVHGSVPAPSPQQQLDQAGFIPLAARDATQPAPQRPIFQPVARVDQVPEGKAQVFQLDRVWILIAHLDGEIYAVRDTCPGSMAPLHLGAFSGPVVVCPWHKESYDLRTGERMDGGKTPHLDVVPVAVSDGVIQVAVNLLPNAAVSAGAKIGPS